MTKELAEQIADEGIVLLKNEVFRFELMGKFYVYKHRHKLTHEQEH